MVTATIGGGAEGSTASLQVYHQGRRWGRSYYGVLVDSWLDGAKLASKFPCLLSHCTQPDASVRDVYTRGLSSMLVPRPSPQASREKMEVATLIAFVTLQQWPDERFSKFDGAANKLDTSCLHRASTHSCDSSMIHSFVWNSRPQ